MVEESRVERSLRYNSKMMFNGIKCCTKGKWGDLIADTGWEGLGMISLVVLLLRLGAMSCILRLVKEFLS